MLANMRMTLKKLAQGILLMTVLICYGLLVVRDRQQSTLKLDQLNDVQNERYYAERPARSVNSKSRVILSSSDINSAQIINEHKVQHNEVPIRDSLNDIFISVKTTKKFHKTRLDVIVRTWFVLARDQTYFFTDFEDQYLQQKTNGHLINTNCSSSHNRKALCCKMSVELDLFLATAKKWFCHFDDDNYVNIPTLVKMLSNYDPLEDWYLGKPSIRKPLAILNRDTGKEISFWFATGGAGFCLSRSLVLKMKPYASGGKFISLGEKIRLPDDVTIGYIVEYLLQKNLTVVEHFHSHLEPMKFLTQDILKDQISFSYSKYGNELNIVPIEKGIDSKVDPTRFLSLHCLLFPNFNYCPK